MPKVRHQYNSQATSGWHIALKVTLTHLLVWVLPYVIQGKEVGACYSHVTPTVTLPHLTGFAFFSTVLEERETACGLVVSQLPLTPP